VLDPNPDGTVKLRRAGASDAVKAEPLTRLRMHDKVRVAITPRQVRLGAAREALGRCVMQA
jgi:hypothetical protein